MAFMALIPLIASMAASTAAAETGRATTLSGAKNQADIERQGREFQEQQFQEQIKRQEPYLEAGRQALPELIAAIKNQPRQGFIVEPGTSPMGKRQMGTYTGAQPVFATQGRQYDGISGLPSYTAQQEAVSSMIGDNAPDYIKERSNQAIGAFEAEKNKGRLLDLVNLGQGSAGNVGQTRVNLGSTLANSYGNVGNLTAGAIQDAAIQRQNSINLVGEGLSGLPAFIAAQRASNRRG